jgi:CPA2 family monovalent cation:H+ antiporter-2
LNDTSLIVLGTLLVITVKFSVLFVLGLLFKLRAANNWMFALSLAQAGEFGFVLLSFSQQNSVLPDALADQLLLVIALSMLLTPILFLLLERLIIPFHRNRGQQPEADEIDARSPVIIAGHGRVGQIVNRILEMSGYQPTVIDVDIEVTEGLSKLGFKTYFGDAGRPELLESAGIAQAKLLVIAIDDKRRALTLAEHVSRDYPHVTIVARAHDRPHTYNLYQAGVRGSIVRETFDSSVRLGWGALEALGHDPELAKEAASIFFDRDRQLVFEAAELHDPNAPRFTNKEMIEKSREMDNETAIMVRAVLQRTKDN